MRSACSLHAKSKYRYNLLEVKQIKSKKYLELSHILPKFTSQLSTMKFSNLKQLFDFFKDEKVCREYLEQERWNGNIECPFCACTKVYRTNRGFKCADK